MNKKILFLSGTRADFGKLKSLIEIVESSDDFHAYIFVTGMHMLSKYGKTVNEIYECNYKNVITFLNSESSESSMELILAKTIEGLSKYIKEFNIDLLVVHGDRVEALAGAIVGSLNNIHTCHIEGGELSGTIDELIRHSVSKMSHSHLVCNEEAKNRLIQMGENEDSIYIIGSPDIDLMISKDLPKLIDVKKHYEIEFNDYAIALFHPVTTEVNEISFQAKNFVNALIQSNKNYILIYPNNDLGSTIIIEEYRRINNNAKIKIFPSIRFESFLVLIKNAKFLIGNSSAGIREAPYYSIPTVNIGTRQNNRSSGKSIINCNYKAKDILDAISKSEEIIVEKEERFGKGNSNVLFYEIINNNDFWSREKQKQFIDRQG